MRLAFACSYVWFVSTQRCASMSRMDRENASKRSRELAAFGLIPRSKTRCRSYRAFSVPTNGIGPQPYLLRSSSEARESRPEISFVLILSPSGSRIGVARAVGDWRLHRFDSIDDVMIVVPKPNHGMRKIVFIPECAQARCTQQEIPAGRTGTER